MKYNIEVFLFFIFFIMFFFFVCFLKISILIFLNMFTKKCNVFYFFLKMKYFFYLYSKKICIQNVHKMTYHCDVQFFVALAWVWCHALWVDVFVIWFAFKWCGSLWADLWYFSELLHAKKNYNVFHSAHKVLLPALLCTTKKAILQQFFTVQNNSPALLCTSKRNASTSLNYKRFSPGLFCSVRQSTRPIQQRSSRVQLCTAKYCPSTKCTRKFHPKTTPYYKVPRTK